MRDADTGSGSPAPARSRPPSGRAHHGAGLRVLLVEDDAGDRMLFRSALRKGGLEVCEVVEAGTLADALACLEDPTPDVVVVDLGLPDAERLSAVDALVASVPDVPVLILTGADDLDFRTQAVAAGAQDYLTKGHLDPHQLAWAIRFAVERAQHARTDLRRAMERLTLARLARAHQHAADLEDLLRRIVDAVREVLPDAAVEAVVTGRDLVTRRHARGEVGTPSAELRLGDDDLRLRIRVRHDAGGDETGVRAFLHRITDTAYDGLRSLRTAGELSLRTRQLSALHDIARSAQDADHDPSSLLPRVAHALAAALPHPDDLRISIDAAGHRTHTGRAVGELVTRVRAVIRVGDAPVGELTAGYTVDHEVTEVDLALLEHTADLLGGWLGRRAAERDRQRERERLEQLMDTAPVGVVLVDAEGAITYLNPGARTIFGVGEDEAFTRVFDDPHFAIEAEDGSHFPVEAHPFVVVRSTGAPVRDVVHAIRWPDGSRRIISVNASPLFSPDGAFDGMVAAVTDVTDERRATRELAESRARLEALLEQLPAVAWTVDPELRLTSLSGSVLTELATIPEVGADLTTIAQHANGHEVIEAHRRALAGERRPVTFSWAGRWCRAVVEPLRDTDGTVVGVVGIGLDVTDRLSAEEALRTSEARFRSIAEHAVEGIFRLQVEPRVALQYANPAFEHIIGYDLATLTEDPEAILRAIHPDDRRSFGGRGPSEVRLHRADGVCTWVRVRLTTRAERDGVVVLQGTLLDITEERDREQALRSALDREQEAAASLRRLDGLKDGFLRAVSHELRTPLTAVYGFASTLRQHHDALEDVHVDELLGRLLTNADRLRRLLEDLLDLNRLTSAVVDAELETVELTALVRRAAEQCPVEGRSLHVAGPAIRAQVDPVQVERIVHNLVLNAVRHAPQGTTIWVTTAAGDDHVSLTVEDDGPGIPDELKTLVLAPFVQGPGSETSAQPGTGIGLSLVQQFVRMHDGTLTIEDRPAGPGTRIQVRFPQPSSD